MIASTEREGWGVGELHSQIREGIKHESVEGGSGIFDISGRANSEGEGDFGEGKTGLQKCCPVGEVKKESAFEFCDFP